MWRDLKHVQKTKKSLSGRTETITNSMSVILIGALSPVSRLSLSITFPHTTRLIWKVVVFSLITEMIIWELLFGFYSGLSFYVLNIWLRWHLQKESQGGGILFTSPFTPICMIHFRGAFCNCAAIKSRNQSEPALFSLFVSPALPSSLLLSLPVEVRLLQQWWPLRLRSEWAEGSALLGRCSCVAVSPLVLWHCENTAADWTCTWCGRSLGEEAARQPQRVECRGGGGDAGEEEEEERWIEKKKKN